MLGYVTKTQIPVDIRQGIHIEKTHKLEKMTRKNKKTCSANSSNGGRKIHKPPIWEW